MALPAAIGHIAHTMLFGLLSAAAGGRAVRRRRCAAAALAAPVAAEDEPPRGKQEFKQAEGNQEVKGRIRAAHARGVAAADDGRGAGRRPGRDEPDPLCGRAEIRRREDGCAARRRQGRRPDRAGDPRPREELRKVPVLQAPVLARALYAHGEVDREIPAALFGAVAQVLAYVYQLRAAMAGQRRDAGRSAAARRAGRTRSAPPEPRRGATR